MAKSGRRRMREAAALVAGAAMLFLPASAQAEGGASIAAAPTVAYGQQEFGSTATGGYLTFGCGPGYRSFWALPVVAGDQVTIDWESTISTTEMVVAPVGTTDYNMAHSDNLTEQALAGNNKNSFQFTAPQTGTMPLWFRSCEDIGATPGPYAFTAADQHALATALTPATYIYPNSAIGGTVSLADGSPTPDGMVFNLIAKWHSQGDLKQVAASAATAGGSLSFPLALPAESAGKKVRLVIARPADPSYLATKSSPLIVTVAGPPKPEVAPVPAHHRRHKHRHHRHFHHRR